MIPSRILEIRRFFWALALLAMLSTPAGVLASEDGDAVRDVFRKYRQAILRDDGGTAASLLGQSTLDYYDEMRRLAIYGDAEAVQSQLLVDQMQILLFRLRVPVETLESLSPKGLVSFSVEQGWIGKSGVSKVEPGRVQSKEDIAIMHVIIDGKDGGSGFRFDREANGWRLDLVSTLKNSNAMFAGAARREGVSNNRYMLAVMGNALKREVGDEVWVPLRTSEEAE